MMTDNSNSQIENLRKRGIEGTIVEDPVTDAKGNPVLDQNGCPIVRRTFVVSHIPDSEREINKFFSESTPCWFPGCEGLRKQYKAELYALEAAGGGCSSCDKGKLYKKFWPLVSAAINSKNGLLTTTGAKQVPGPGEGSQGRTVQKRTLLRRACSGIASIFKVGKGKGHKEK